MKAGWKSRAISIAFPLRVIFSLCLPTLATTSVSSGSSWFQIQGADASAVDHSHAQVLLLEEWIPKYFSAPRKFEPAIRFNLIDEKALDDEKSFVIQITGSSEVTLQFSSRALQRPEILDLALIKSFLVRRQIWATGNSQLYQASNGFFVSVAAAFRDYQEPYRFAIDAGSTRPTGNNFLELDLPDSPGESTFIQGYYQWEFGKALAGNPSTFQQLLQEQLQGSTNLRIWMERAGFPVPETISRELLWQTWLAAQIDRQTGPVMDVEASRDYFFELQQLTIQWGNERVRVSVADLWEYRKLSWLENERQLRLIRLKRFLPRVNPVFFNTFHSLGKVLESLEGNRRIRFEAAVDQLARDLAAAEEQSRILKSQGF